MNPEQLRLNAQVEEEHWWFVGRRRILRQLVARLLPQEDALVIDVGCGTGGNIGALAQTYRAIGIDTSPAAIELARSRFPQAQFILGQAPADLGPAVGQARLFLLMDVLEHVRDDYFLLSNLLAAAAPGTLFFITVPADPALWSEHDKSHLHYRRYDADGLAALWAGLPVKVRQISYFNAFLYRPIKVIRWINRLRGKASGHAGTDLWVPARPINGLLTSLFAHEGARLSDVLAGRRAGYPHGVSLMAIIERAPGPITPRTRPATAAPDLFDPERAGLVEVQPRTARA